MSFGVRSRFLAGRAGRGFGFASRLPGTWVAPWLQSGAH